MIGAAGEKNIPYQKIGTLIKHDQMRTIEITVHPMLARTGIITFAIIKGQSVSIDGSVPFYSKVSGINSIQENYVPIARWNTVACCIVFAFGTAQQFCRSRQVKCNI